LNELLADAYMMSNLEKLYPGKDIKKSLENSLLKMWRIEKGWEFKKKRAAASKTARINMKQQMYDTVCFHLVDKTAFSKPVQKPEPVSPERQNIHLQQLAADIGKALFKIRNRDIDSEYYHGFEEALLSNNEGEYLERFYARLQREHPEAFKIEKSENDLFAESARALVVNGEQNRKMAKQILGRA
jgi:hypothetical protein